MTSTRSSSDALTTCQPCVILFYSIGNCFDQIEPSRSATERSGVRFRKVSNGTSPEEKIYNISVNSMRSEGEQDLVFHSEFQVSKFDVYTGFLLYRGAYL